MPAATDDASGERKEGLGLARLDLAAAEEVALGLPMVDVAVGKVGFFTSFRFGCRGGGGGRRTERRGWPWPEQGRTEEKKKTKAKLSKMTNNQMSHER